NTCSIREKAAQKVFQRLNDFKFAAKANQKVIGVLGCVAQQEGEEIFERAPWVSLVCGSASYRNLPSLIEQVESGGRRVTGLDLPELTGPGGIGPPRPHRPRPRPARNLQNRNHARR